MVTSHAQSASYTSSGFSARMGWGNHPALLLIDVCTAYFTPGSPLDLTSNPSYTAASASPSSMRRLLLAARASKVPIIWTTVRYERHGELKDAGLFKNKATMLGVFQGGDERGLGGWLESEGLVPDEQVGELVVAKKYPSAFFETDLRALLKEKGVDTVVVCGVSTSGCVRASALDAMCCGFRPMVVREACGDRSEDVQNSNLFDLDAKYADVVSEQEAIEKLFQGWQ